MTWFCITLIVSMAVIDGINAGVVVRRRPISIHERIPFTTTQATTTTTTTLAPEESTVVNRFSRLTLPSNATSIRSEITDSFSCAGRPYGYYADVENDCQIFHVCLPVTYPDGHERQFRWSFICPEETTFNQEAFTCVRTDEMNIDCTESEQFYELNRILGLKEETVTPEVTSNELSSDEHDNVSNEDRYNLFQTKESNQRFGAPASNGARITSSPGPTRNHINYRPTAAPYVSTGNTERIPQTTSYRQFNQDRTNDLVSTTFPPVNIAQFFDLTTRRYNNPITTFRNNADFTTDATEESAASTNYGSYTTSKYDSNTRIVPDLIEGTTNAKTGDQTDEVVESIKQLQKLYPSMVNDSREKRFLFKADSVKNRQKLFGMLNH